MAPSEPVSSNSARALASFRSVDVRCRRRGDHPRRPSVRRRPRLDRRTSPALHEIRVYTSLDRQAAAARGHRGEGFADEVKTRKKECGCGHHRGIKSCCSGAPKRGEITAIIITSPPWRGRRPLHQHHHHLHHHLRDPLHSPHSLGVAIP